MILSAVLMLCAAPVMSQGPLPLGSQTAGPLAEAPLQASFEVWWSVVGDEYEVHFQLSGAEGESFAVLGAPSGGAGPTPPSLVGVAPLDPNGDGSLCFMLRRMPGTPFHFTAAYKLGRQVAVVPGPDSDGADLVCDSLDFDYTLGADWAMTSGRQIDEQWADIGMHVTARSAVPGKPDMAILFDSDLPSLHDPDLVVGEGQLLILPENDFDVAPFDGLVDVPDDSASGGSMFFDFDMAYDLMRVKLVDFDEPGSQLKFFRDHNVVTPGFVIDIPVVGDGELQTLIFNQPNVTRVELVLAGSGAVVGVCGIPCPRVINFDESPFGRPLDIAAGLIVDDQFYDSGLGVRISAINGYGSGQLPAQNHPDEVVVFDSDFPSGGDWDLGVYLGNIVVIAEDDFDHDPVDGLVDDPDDEAEGGVITFELGRNIVGFRATLVDVDEAAGPSELRCYDEYDVMLGTPIPLVPGPDGNIQVITAEFDTMRRLELSAHGSAALAELRYCIRNGQ